MKKLIITSITIALLVSCKKEIVEEKDAIPTCRISDLSGYHCGDGFHFETTGVFIYDGTCKKRGSFVQGWLCR